MVCVPEISTMTELGDDPSNSSRLEVVAEHQGHLTLHQVGVTLAQHRQYVRSRCSRDTLGQSPVLPGSTGVSRPHSHLKLVSPARDLEMEAGVEKVKDGHPGLVVDQVESVCQ